MVIDRGTGEEHCKFERTSPIRKEKRRFGGVREGKDSPPLQLRYTTKRGKKRLKKSWQRLRANLSASSGVEESRE